MVPAEAFNFFSIIFVDVTTVDYGGASTATFNKECSSGGIWSHAMKC